MVNGHSWATHNWSSAGAALEPSIDPLPSLQSIQPAAADHHDDSLTTTLVRPPHFVPFSTAEDPYADELAQRSAEFARHAALDDPTPPQGLPSLPPHWGSGTTGDEDPPLAASLSLGQRFELAFADELEEGEDDSAEDTLAVPAVQSPSSLNRELNREVGREVGRELNRELGREVTREHSREFSGDPILPTERGSLVDRSPFADRGPLSDRGPLADRAVLSERGPLTDREALADRALADERVTLSDRGPLGDRVTPSDRAQLEDENTLPQRVPSEPDVPENVEPADDLPVAGMPQLSRIVSGLRRPDDFRAAERLAGFDTDAVLSAVRAVAGVREAIMRTTPSGAHHLRLELAEGADPATISRMVARMLQEQMGIDAALAGDGPARIPGQAGAQEIEQPAPPVSLPGPRVGTGATPPSANFEQRPPVEAPPPYGTPQQPREGRRRHPVSVPRRQPSEVRPVERPVATWRSTVDADQPAGATSPPLHTEHEQGPRAIIEHVQTSTFGLDATVEVRLNSGDRQASGVASGPAVDAYVLRLCAAATAAAVDDLLRAGTSTGEAGRCFVEHAAIVPMGSCDVAVVVVLLVCGGWVEQLAGSALVSGDPRRAVVRATLGAVNRRLAALLPTDD